MLLPLHIAGGALAIVSGLVALYTRKGSTIHRRSGTTFVAAMLVLAASGAIIAVGRRGAAINVPAGLVTCYLVVTGLLAVRAPSRRSREVEQAAMVAAFVIGAGTLLGAVSVGSQGNGSFAFPMVMFGCIAIAAAVGDRRMLRAGGLAGTARLRRHLWRMCVALFIAAASFFLGPVGRVPGPLRALPFQLLPLLVLLTMTYWLWRYRAARRGRSPTAADWTSLYE